MHSLSDYKGQWLIVYFYPKDDTEGCTKEACSFRDRGEEFTKQGIAIVGISKDSVASHKKFEAKYHLNFPLLSDPDHTVISSYGAWGKKKLYGKEYEGILRNTYVVNPKGEIRKTYEKVNPLKHATQILTDLPTLGAKR